MKSTLAIAVSLVFSVALSAVEASAFTVTGKVNDESGKAIEKASVTLLGKGLRAETDATGSFTLHQDEATSPNPGGNQDSSVTPGPVGPQDPTVSVGGNLTDSLQGLAVSRPVGYLSVNNGVLSFSQSSGSPVRVQVYDMVGNRLLNETLYGTGTVDMKASIKARGTYFARVKVGNAQKNFRFTADGSFSATFGEKARVRALLKVGDNDDLRVIANGYDTLTVHLTNLDTNLTLVLKKPAPPQPQYAYGWGLKNDPVPSSGCGKDTKLDYKYRGDKPYIEFKWSKGTRTVRIDIPKSYDKNKPYKLIFGMQCMGGWAGGVQDEGYYGLKQFDKDETVIFVAPEGNGNQAPWDQNDYILFDELLAYLEGNFCIDSSRVFSTGFSYGSMFSNGLSWNHQEVLRAVAVYETAERNIWLPERKKMGVGWMGVLGLQDDLCRPEMGRAARDIILELNSEGGKAKNEKAQEYGGNGPHVCYDYTTVEERFPVRWCTQNGGHIWDHKDPGQQQSWVPQTTWDFFSKF